MKRSRDRDIITGLPETLIHRIFSFLPTKDAVRTSLLSRGWRDRWRSSPFLSFIGSDFGNAQKFCLFIDTVLHIREPVSLHTFRLTLEWDETDLPLFNAWIHHAVRHNVRELFLDLSYKEDSRIMLPSCLFSCITLKKFSIKTISRAKFQPPVSVALDGLRNLRFDSIELEAVDLKKILAGCSVLEELHLQYCTLVEPTFSAQKLKFLEIVVCFILGPTTITSIPRLEELVFSNNNIMEADDEFVILLEKLPSLISCTIHLISVLDWKGVWFKGDGHSKKLNYLEMSLQDMQGVLEAPFSFLAYPCTLYNLKHLKLHIFLNNLSIEVVNQLLTYMPNLETLVIKETKDPYYKESEESISNYIKLPSHLRSVDVVALTPLHMGINLQSGCFHIKGTLQKGGYIVGFCEDL